MSLLDGYAERLAQLKAQANLRQFSSYQQQGRFIRIGDKSMLNLASNDYLGLATDLELRTEFFDTLDLNQARFSSSSSRLLTGNFEQYEQLEHSLSQAFGRAALLFNSGYHMNIGILPALCDSKTIILADKLVHASMMDGMRLATAQYVRYRHNDLQHLQQLLQKYQQDEQVERIIVVTESIFSMDGDETDLAALVRLKQCFDKTMLYVDDAHAIGVRGARGLGCAEQYGVIEQIDFLVGTFGKALASVGGYILCDPIIREYLINKMRPLIFSTALPPISVAWSDFMLHKVLTMHAQRQHLAEMSQYVQQAVLAKGFVSPSSSHIIPIIVGESQAAIAKVQQLQQQGFYAMPVRPPTVPQHSSRLRICLTTLLRKTELQQLVACL